MLAHWRGSELRDQGLSHPASYRVLRRHRDQWTTVAADEETAVVLFELSESYVRIKHAEDILAVDLVARRGDSKEHRVALAPIARVGSVEICLEGLASIAAAEGKIVCAARLWGAAEALLEDIELGGTHMYPTVPSIRGR